jgi:hypothetical protein
MFLVQLLLPLADNDGNRFAASVFDATRVELIERFGGLTAFFRSPASGAWEAPDGTMQHDAIVVLEVMTESVDREWWKEYRERLARRFAQDEVVNRSSTIELL